MVLNVHRNTSYQGRGEGGKGVGGGGEREITYLLLHYHHESDSCVKMGSDESHFNVSFTVRTRSQDSAQKPQPVLKRKM